MGFFFILKNVLFKEINDIEIPITFSNQTIFKHQCLAIFCILGVNCVTKKCQFNLKTAENLAFLPNRKSVPLGMRS